MSKPHLRCFLQGSQTSLSLLFSASWWMSQAELFIFWELSSWGGECGISARSGVTQPCVCLYAEGNLTSDKMPATHTRIKGVLKFWRSPLHHPEQRSILQLERSYKTRINVCLCIYFSMFYMVFEDVHLSMRVDPKKQTKNRLLHHHRNRKISKPVFCSPREEVPGKTHLFCFGCRVFLCPSLCRQSFSSGIIH